MAEKMENEQFIQRLGNLPMVSSAWNLGCDVYQKTKASNSLIKKSFDMAEGSVKTVANTSLPLIAKVQPQIDYVNQVAVQQLVKLEEKYPVITKSPNQVYNEGKEACKGACHTVVQPAVNGYNSVVTMGTEQITRVKNVGQNILDKTLETSYGKYVADKVDDVLTYSENYVDKYLCESDETCKMEVDMVTKNPITRVGVLSHKVRQRMYKKAMTDITQVKIRSQEAIDKLKFNVDLIEYARSNIDGAKSHMNETWSKLTMAEDIPEPKTLEDKSINVTRNLAHQVRNSFTTLKSYSDNGSDYISQQLKMAKTYADDIYISFTKVDSYDEIPTWVLNQTKDKLSYLTEILSFTADIVFLTPVRWLTIDYDINEINFDDDEVAQCNGVGSASTMQVACEA
ncbi:hypothetical protein LOTGIDRAFT_162734 [Lottia gigantea]|uniref:Perilipin n=1 Tax=Lottia gigantea TaxID=225164 RepID=V3ZM47_LOTGI|nr:hypothetical protein LOTGIDRAFT_162734 [Lottia gigantea]ESO92428.1 hypothetical protein LOTGIDRAFT_162734 [Lottia gigantea]